jgi:cation transport regulator ChaB
VRCYRSLPKAMQDALWRRFGAGYEEAFIAAQKWLKDRNPQGRLPL